MRTHRRVTTGVLIAETKFHDYGGEYEEYATHKSDRSIIFRSYPPYILRSPMIRYPTSLPAARHNF